MVRDRPTMKSAELTVMLDTPGDADAQATIRGPEGPTTTSGISDTYDIPFSMACRKLNLLTDATFLSEETQIHADGHHAMTYEVASDEMRTALNDERDFDIVIGHPEQTSDEHLADIWSRVRRET